MGKRSTIYFGEKLNKHTSSLREGDSVSGRINRTVDRYLAICQSHGVELTEIEAEFLATFLGDGWVEPIQIKYLPQEIRQAKSDVVDAKRLADKLDQVGFADLVSMVESMGR